MVTKGLLYYFFIIIIFYNTVVVVLILLCYFLLTLSLFFPAQKDFQGEDAMWLNQKVTQKKQCVAAII